MTIIESGNAATKIGQQNQWLQVKASDGTEGYVAAWYVAKVVAVATASACDKLRRRLVFK